MHDNFTANFLSLTGQAAHCSEECAQARFIHTFYLHDMILVMAQALTEAVDAKAASYGISPQDVVIERSDRTLIAKKLLEIDLQEGVTGPVFFDENGNRNTFLFELRNFVPVDNANFSVDTAITEDPWDIQTRGILTKEGDNITYTFYTADGNKSDTSTIIFADGTTNIPLDRAARIYVRSES